MRACRVGVTSEKRSERKILWFGGVTFIKSKYLFLLLHYRRYWSQVWKLLSFKAEWEEMVFGLCIISPASTYGCFLFRHMLWGLSWPRAARESQHMDSIGGIIIQCCDVIKRLSGGGMSEGFTAGGFIPHKPSGTVLQNVFSLSWPRSLMLNGFRAHKPFNLALFLLFFLPLFLLERDMISQMYAEAALTFWVSHQLCPLAKLSLCTMVVIPSLFLFQWAYAWPDNCC